MIEPLIIQRHGRWEFATHDWFRVANVAACKDQGADWIAENYPTLSREEIAAGMVWTFPPIHDAPKVDTGNVEYGAWCVCGEWKSIDEWMSDGTCPFCGSSFSVTITLTTRQ